MNRKIRLSLKGQLILSERYDSHLRLIKDGYQKDGKNLEREYLEMWKKLLAVVNKLQKEGKKGKTKYLVISLLHSSFVTRTYDFRFDVYDKDLYLDSAETCAYWCPVPFFEFIAEDITCFSYHVKDQMIQVTDVEIEEFEMEYAYRYAGIAFSFFCETCKKIFELKEYKEMIKEDRVSIRLGNYIGKSRLIAEQEAIG